MYQKTKYLLNGIECSCKDKWQIDKVGLYSMTPGVLSNFIWKRLNIGKNDYIMETCGGVGGDTVVLTKLGANIVVFENDTTRYQMIKNNIGLVGNMDQISVINADCNIDNYQYCNVLYMDVPWGGPGYKKNGIIDTLYLGDKEVSQFVMEFSKKSKKQDLLIVLKLPYNFNYIKLTETLKNKIKITSSEWIRPPSNKRGKVIGIGWYVAKILN